MAAPAFFVPCHRARTALESTERPSSHIVTPDGLRREPIASSGEQALPLTVIVTSPTRGKCGSMARNALSPDTLTQRPSPLLRYGKLSEMV